MNNKDKILKEYIKRKIRSILNEKKLSEKEDAKNLARIGLISKRFPSLKQSLEKLMSNSFAYYVKDISIISPKPTTFRVVLNNNLDFEMKYTNKTFVAKISGKKYYLLNVDESQEASESITELLSLSPAQPEAENPKQSQQQFDQGLSNDLNNMSSGGGFSAGGPEPTGLPELQPEDIPTSPVSGGGETSNTPSPQPPSTGGGFGTPSP